MADIFALKLNLAWLSYWKHEECKTHENHKSLSRVLIQVSLLSDSSSVWFERRVLWL